MPQPKSLRSLVVLSMIFVATRASGQVEACGKLLLLPLLYKDVQIAEDDQGFMNIYYYCMAQPQSEEEALEEGIDLDWVYDKALPQEPKAPGRFDKLGAWAKDGCPKYLEAGSARLPQTINATRARVDTKIEEVYEQCLLETRPSCYAIPAGQIVGNDVVGLLIKWSPSVLEADPTAEVKIKTASATGAMQPRDMLAIGTSAASESSVASLTDVAVPRSGLLRSFLRTDKAADVRFKIETSAGTAECAPEKVGSVVTAVGDFKRRKHSIALQTLVWIDVKNLQEWIEEIRNQNKLPKPDATEADLVPIIDGVPIPDIHPMNLGDKVEVVDGARVRRLRFDIERNEKNKDAWSQILRLNSVAFSREVEVTVGFENGQAMDTLITYPSKEDKAGKPRASLKVIPEGQMALGLLLIGGGLAFFLLLAAKTDVIRDTTVLFRPDGRSPFSLGRTQMAFWFFLVVTFFFVLWMVTGDKDTITNSTMGLIGISAATALGAAFVDSTKTNKAEKAQRVAKVEDFTKRPREIAARLRLDLEPAEKKCRELTKVRATIKLDHDRALALKDTAIEQKRTLVRELEIQRGQIAPENTGALAAKDDEIKKAKDDLTQTLQPQRDQMEADTAGALKLKDNEIEKTKGELALLRQQIDFFNLPSWRRFLNDLLTEDDGISFHKFQIFIWTLILGVIFIYEVLINLAMPEFNAALLAIMGVSGGTYIGFKLPPGAKQNEPASQETAK